MRQVTFLSVNGVDSGDGCRMRQFVRARRDVIERDFKRAGEGLQCSLGVGRKDRIAINDVDTGERFRNLEAIP